MSTTIPEREQARARIERDLFVSAPDVAAVIGLSMGLVYAGLRDGTIPSVRLGQRYRIPSAWVRQQAGL